MVSATEQVRRIVAERARKKGISTGQKAAGTGRFTVNITDTRKKTTTTISKDLSTGRTSRRTRRATPRELSKPQLEPTKRVADIQKVLDKTPMRKLIEIERNKKISVFEKEKRKRALLGMPSGVGVILTRKIDNAAKKQSRIITGTITPGNIKRGTLEQVELELSDRWRKIAITRAEARGEFDSLKAVGLGITATAIGTIRRIPQKTWQVILTVLRPDQVAKGLYKLATDRAVQQEVNSRLNKFSKDLQAGEPSAVAEIVSEIAGFGAGNKILKEAGKVATITKPIRTIREARFIISQPKELRPFVKQVLKGARVQEGLKPVNLKGIKKINFNEVAELNKIEGIALKKTLQNTDSAIFGSLSGRTLSGGKTKLPKDVDIATKNIKDFQQKFISNLPKNQQKLYSIGKESIKKGGLKILDIKAYSRLRPDQTIFGTGRLPINTVIYETGRLRLKEAGLKIPTESLVKVEGIKLVGFSEQTTRKGLGTLQVILEKSGRRAKDPAAFVEGLEIQLASLKGQIPKTGIIKKYLLKTKAKDLEVAIKLLKSKKFEALLKKKVPNILKEYPILKKTSKVNKSKLSKSVREKINKIKTKLKKSKTVEKVKKATQKTKKTTKMAVSKIPKVVKKSSKIPRTSKTRSRIPKSKTPKSRIPKSKAPSSRLKPSKLPTSKLPPSKLPTKKAPTSKLTPSKTPTSKLPPSKLPPSRLPPSKIPASRVPPTKVPPSKVIRIDWDFNKKDNKVYVFDVVYIESRNANKNYNPKTNPRVVKKKRLTTTRNRAYKEAARLADVKTIRSIDIKLVGRTVNKKPEIALPTRLKKFRPSKSAKVLKLVEKSKFTIDSKNEKRLLSKARKQAPKKTKKVTKRVLKSKTTKKPKKSPKTKPKKTIKKTKRKNK